MFVLWGAIVEWEHIPSSESDTAKLLPWNWTQHLSIGPPVSNCRVSVLSLHLFCARCPKVTASSLYTISACERFHRNGSTVQQWEETGTYIFGKRRNSWEKKNDKMRIVVIWRRGRKCAPVKMHMVSVILHLLKRVVICMLVLAALFLVCYCKFEIF